MVRPATGGGKGGVGGGLLVVMEINQPLVGQGDVGGWVISGYGD